MKKHKEVPIVSQGARLADDIECNPDWDWQTVIESRINCTGHYHGMGNRAKRRANSPSPTVFRLSPTVDGGTILKRVF